MDPEVVVDLEDRPNNGKRRHEEMMQFPDYTVVDQNPEILELRYLKARVGAYQGGTEDPQFSEANNLAAFRASSPDQQLAMVKYLEHMSSYVRAGESMASIITGMAVRKGWIEESAATDHSLISRLGGLLSPFLDIFPSTITNILCTAASILPHLRRNVPEISAPVYRDPNPTVVVPVPLIPVPAELVVNIDGQLPDPPSIQDTQ